MPADNFTSRLKVEHHGCDPTERNRLAHHPKNERKATQLPKPKPSLKVKHIKTNLDSGIESAKNKDLRNRNIL